MSATHRHITAPAHACPHSTLATLTMLSMALAAPVLAQPSARAYVEGGIAYSPLQTVLHEDASPQTASVHVPVVFGSGAADASGYAGFGVLRASASFKEIGGWESSAGGGGFARVSFHDLLTVMPTNAALIGTAGTITASFRLTGAAEAYYEGESSYWPSTNEQGTPSANFALAVRTDGPDLAAYSDGVDVNNSDGGAWARLPVDHTLVVVIPFTFGTEFPLNAALEAKGSAASDSSHVNIGAAGGSSQFGHSAIWQGITSVGSINGEIGLAGVSIAAASGTNYAGSLVGPPGWVHWAQNGHDYQAVSVLEGISWSQANAQAIALGGHLVTITSEAENAFVFGLVDNPEYWRVPPGTSVNAGPWLGGFQPAGTCEPSCGWQWVTGEPWQFTTWNYGQPDNSAGQGIEEDVLQMWSGFGFERSTQWNDWSDGPQYLSGSFVVERECTGSAPTITAQPQPASICPGGTATFTVSASGTSPGYQWQIESTPLGSDSWSNLGNGPLLRDGQTIGSVEDAQSATLRYTMFINDGVPIRSRCIVTDTCAGVTSDPATLTIVPCGNPQGWTGISLHPVGSSQSLANRASGGQQVGFSRVGTENDPIHASLWNGTAASWVDLHPAAASLSFAQACSGGQQVGYAVVDGKYHASVWNGTAASWVDLHPPGANFSSVTAINGTQLAIEVQADPFGVLVASFRSGPDAPWVSLHPLGTTATRSGVSAIDGSQQVGGIVFEFGVYLVPHAGLWSGTAASWVDLHPAGAFESSASGLGNGKQGGWVNLADGHHASLWSGTAASWVDLNPAGATLSEVTGVSGELQVGVATFNGTQRAGVWSGTAASWVDLSAFVPAGFSSSIATGISDDGVTVYVTGYGQNAANNRFEALLWTRPLVTACGLADVGRQGGLPGANGILDNNDFVVFIDLFFNQQPAADLGKQGGILGSDGQFDNNDFVVFIDQFFAAC